LEASYQSEASARIQEIQSWKAEKDAREKAEAELQSERTRLAAEEDRHRAALRALDAAIEECNAAKSRTAELEAETAKYDEMRAGYMEQANRRIDVAEAALTEAQAEIMKLTAAEQSARAERDLFSADIDTLQSQVAGAELALETERAQARTRHAQMVTAFRGVFVDTIERLLYREGERARKAQATPEKLRAWIGNFYPMHAEAVRDALRPVVRAWAVLVDAEAEPLLDRLVQDHVEASARTLRQVADVDDPDQMASALDRALRRWETERAHTVAEAILQEGLTHG
jgi:DNA repair exonuclease SbcCD ATPase subunit